MKLHVFFDYACPFCYAGISYLDEMQSEFLCLELDWVPIEAHTRAEGAMIITPESEGWWNTKLQERHSLPHPIVSPVSPSPFGDRAMYGFHFIRENGGTIWPYHRAVYEAMFQNKKNIEDIAVLRACAVGANVDLDAFCQAIEDGRYEATLKEANHYAYETLGVEYIPTFISGEQRLASVASHGITRSALREFLLGLYSQTT